MGSRQLRLSGSEGVAPLHCAGAQLDAAWGFREEAGQTPEATLPYQLVEQHCPALRALRSEAGLRAGRKFRDSLDCYLGLR